MSWVKGCCRVTNTDHFLPEHQDIAVGDHIRLHPTAPPMHLAHLDRPTNARV